MRPVPILVALVAASTVVRAWAGLRVPTPWIAADEMIYAELGRSLWETGRLAILDADTPFYSLVHPALIGLPLALFDTALGYDVARVLQALVMCLTAVPVFLWGRRLMSERWALAAAALTLTLPGFAYSGLLMSEPLFLPVMTLATWAAWRALVSPTAAAQALLAGAVALAVLTRLQGIVLVPAILLALGLFAVLQRETATLRRAWPAAAALVAIGAAVVLAGFGAYGPAGTASYDLGGALRFVVYHGASALLLVGVVPACAVALLAVRPPPDRNVRAYLAVTLAVSAGLVAEVGIFASRYVGRLAERDLLPVAPLLFLGLCLWLDRGAPRPRLASSLVAFGALALVLVLPLGRLVHRAALPDALTLVPVWRLGSYELVVWGFAAAAVVAFALLPPRALVVLPAAIALVLATTSVAASRHVEREASLLASALHGPDPAWVDAHADGPVAYFYDGEPSWNAVWSYVFWNRRIERVLWLDGTRRVPGPLPQERVRPAPDGRIADDPSPYLLASTAFTFAGEQVAAVEQQGLLQRGLVLWRLEQPARLLTLQRGVHGSGDIYGPAQLVAYGCDGGAFALTLVAKGAPVNVLLRTAATLVERELEPEEVWNVEVPAGPADGVCTLDLEPSGLVGSTRLEFVRS